MTDLYVIEITTASPLPTGFSREEEAESLEVGKLVYVTNILLKSLINLLYILVNHFLWHRLQLRY